MAELLFIAFSDLHISDWGRFESRTDTAFKILRKLQKKAMRKRVPLVHTGDLFDRPDKMSNGLMARITKEFTNIFLENMYCISGNHSCDTITRVNPDTGDGEIPRSWEQYFSKCFPWIKPLDFRMRLLKDNFVLWGVPYLDHNIGLTQYLSRVTVNNGKKNILLLHTDYPGAKDTNGIEVGSSENINTNLINKFDLVLCGHIHKPQRLSKKVYMLGAPYQQRRTDKDCEMGYWEVYDDLTLKFKPLKRYPKFIDVDSEEDIKDDGNYYTVVKKPIDTQQSQQETKVTTDLSKTKMVKTYLKEIGVNDKEKKRLVINTIKEVESC